MNLTQMMIKMCLQRADRRRQGHQGHASPFRREGTDGAAAPETFGGVAEVADGVSGGRICLDQLMAMAMTMTLSEGHSSQKRT